jgi:hypothetical protein
MHTAYRSFILALGLILAAAHPAPGRGPQAKDAADNQIQRSLEDIAASQREAVKRSPLNEPCRYGESMRSSDLCAQWKAADAAYSSAYATWLFGALGSLVGGLTLAAAWSAAKWARKAAIYTENAVAAANKANELTENLVHVSTRPYIVLESFGFVVRPAVFPDEHMEDVGYLTGVLKNIGQSPATNVSSVQTFRVIPADGLDVPTFSPDTMPGINTIGPGIGVNIGPLLILGDELKGVLARTHAIILYVLVGYGFMLNQELTGETEACLRIKLNSLDTTGPLEMTGAALGPQNRAS